MRPVLTNEIPRTVEISWPSFRNWDQVFARIVAAGMADADVTPPWRMASADRQQPPLKRLALAVLCLSLHRLEPRRVRGAVTVGNELRQCIHIVVVGPCGNALNW